MKNCPLFYVIILGLVLNISTSSAQQDNSEELKYVAFDELVGLENTSLYQGKIYFEEYRTINDQNQFFSTVFINGNVWYKGQPYLNQLLKYNVYEDELLLKLKGNGNTLELSKKDIDSFSIGKHNFINLKPKEITTLGQYGYHEVMFQDHMFVLYAKHAKELTERKDRNYAYYEFKNAKKRYLLMYNGDYYTLNSKKDILRVFPDYRKEVTKLYNSAKKSNKGDSDALILTVVKRLKSIL